MLQFTVGGASSLLLQRHHGPHTGVHLQSQIISILTYNWSSQLNNSKVIKWLIYMLRKLDAFHCNIKGWWVFVPGVHPPPLKRLDCFRLPLCPRWRTIQLEAKFTINIQHTICTNNLVDTGGKYVQINKAIWGNKLFISVRPHHNTLRNAHAIFLNPRSCLSTSTLALASSIEMKSRIFLKHLRQLLTAS